MIYIEKVIEINKGEAKIKEPICLYKGDKNIEIRFIIKNNPFKQKSSLTINYGQLIIKRENAPDIFSEVTKINNNKIVFIVTGDMIDELHELGEYTFQIRLFNADQSSRGTLPPVEAGIVIREPLCEEPLEPPKAYMNPDFYEIRTNGGTNYNHLFSYLTLDKLDLSAWDTSNVINMDYMFENCDKLTSLDLSNFDTSNVTNMQGMFYDCDNLTSLNLSNFDMNKVKESSILSGTYDMFISCTNLHTLRLDNCNSYTVNRIITSINFPTGTINGVTRKIYCKEANAADLTAPNGWEFIYIG